MSFIEEITSWSSEESLYEMLAEEAAELSSAASKYARLLRGEQPVREGLTKEILLEHVIEEYADVDVSMMAAAAKTEDEFEAPFVWNKVNHMVMKKIERWYDRLDKDREKETEIKELLNYEHEYEGEAETLYSEMLILTCLGLLTMLRNLELSRTTIISTRKDL